MAYRFSKRSIILAVTAIIIVDVWFYYFSMDEGSSLGFSFTSTSSDIETTAVEEAPYETALVAVEEQELKEEAKEGVKEEVKVPEAAPLKKEEQRRSAVGKILETIIAHTPNTSALNQYNGHPPNQMYNGKPDPVFTKEFLEKFLVVDEAHQKEITSQHSKFVEVMKTSLNYDFEKENMKYENDGIVYVGGLGSFNWLVLLSIRHVRHLGSKLPIEVILPKHEDAEPGYCERLAEMNATCVILEDYTDSKVKGFQLKGLALLVSSFERVLLLDADNIPAHNPDVLFKEGPFTKHGLIVWPDYWRRATQPIFYDIAGITLGTERVSFGENDKEKNDEQIPVHDLKNGVPNPSSESGQLLLNKRTNWYTTLLSTYYNFHGPDYYYPLFSQGTLGQGDKETFLSACVATQESFYQIKRFVIPFGHFNRNGHFRGGAIGQFDPIQDEIHSADRENNKGPRVQFVHSNTPKLNPLGLRTAKELVEEDQRKRLYGTGMRKSIGYDMEWVLWEHMRVLLCEEKVQMSTWNENSVEDLCKEVSEQCLHLEKSAKNNE